MKFNYKFHNLCGTAYTCGNVIFTPDGNSLLSPVGNRVTVFDLVQHSARTLPFEARKNIHRIAIDPQGKLLIVTDIDGRGMVVNFLNHNVLHRFNFKKRVKDLAFSPSGQFLAVSHGKLVQVWRTPALEMQFAPLVLHRVLSGHHDSVVSVKWSADGKYLITGAKDASARVHALDKDMAVKPVTLSGHRDRLVCACFITDPSDASPQVVTVSKDGGLFVWTWEWDESARGGEEANALRIEHGKWTVTAKHYLQKDGASVKSTAVKDKELLLVGFSNGVFTLYELPSITVLQSLSVSQHNLRSAAMNPSGEWLALGSSEVGQLLVWEWQSETYVLKQQGHLYDLNIAAYSPDGQLIATGGDDNKVKLWSTSSGFCFVTFTEHEAPVTALSFVGEGNAVVSASLDGTVRAFDLVRYKNFRVMKAPHATQLISLAVDGEGEVVCAGGMDPPEIFVWSLQTGKLLDVLAGHTGPVSSLTFALNHPLLASSSWDRTVKLWEPYTRTTAIETFEHNSDVLSVCFRPDGKELCSAALDGQLYLWNPETGKQLGSIEGRRDVAGGRRVGDRRSAENATHNKHFTSVCYSADGQCVIAGGRSKFVCIYEVSQRILLKKFQLSTNRSLDGVLDMLNSKHMTEAGPVQEFDISDSDSENEGPRSYLPGAKRGDAGKRIAREEVRCKSVHFSPTGQEWAATSTEGLLVYTLDNALILDPINITAEVTPQAVEARLQQSDYAQALVMGLHLGEQDILTKVYRTIPAAEVDLLAKSLPLVYIEKMLDLVAAELLVSANIEYNMKWALALLTGHDSRLRNHAQNYIASFRALQKAIAQQQKALSTLCEENLYALKVIATPVKPESTQNGSAKSAEHPQVH